MRWRTLIWLAVCALCATALFVFWSNRTQQAEPASQTADASQIDPGSAVSGSTPRSAQAIELSAEGEQALLNDPPRDPVAPTKAAEQRERRLKYRLTNTDKPLVEMERSARALLLENALIDTSGRVELAIPAHLQAQGDSGSYIVQSRRPIDADFRRRVREAGATIVAYIPNNALLIRSSASGVQRLANSRGQPVVLPYEPYYKLKSSLLALAVEQQSLPAGSTLNVLVFADAREATLNSVANLGAQVIAEQPSPFGPVFTVQPPQDSLGQLAQLPGVQAIEQASRRQLANDLSRVRIGLAGDSQVQSNHLTFNGSNVLVAVNDSGVDFTHPDLTNRVFGFTNFLDLSGHGTHVAGIIGGDGTMSQTVSNAFGSIMPATTNQFRGVATNVNFFSLPLSWTDFDRQQIALTNGVLISNNSWNYLVNEYDIAAASYDAAVRDSLPGATGSQPLIYVFSAGNEGDAPDNGQLGTADSILSPATAKNVITVGALEQLRNITNEVVVCETVVVDGTNTLQCVTNQPWAGRTDSDNEVAPFSSRGNVGVGLETDAGRFKPDLVAPGTFVISTRSQVWDTNAYYSNTNHFFRTLVGQVVEDGELNDYSTFLPENTVGFEVSVDTNTTLPPVDLTIYVKHGSLPTAVSYDAIGTNRVLVTPPVLDPVDDAWFFSVGSPTNVPVRFDLTTHVITTNNVGNYFDVLRTNLNDALAGTNPPFYYRYESGTSLSAAQVSGALALMADFFTNRLGTMPSPALMKALLINGARGFNAAYDFKTTTELNHQGWGLLNITNSLPPSIVTNAANEIWPKLTNGPGPLLIFDQNPEEALATGDTRTYVIDVQGDAMFVPLRISLVWTDPPGNPAAGIKLVNNLDLIVTNLDDPGVIYIGNDFPSDNVFSQPWNPEGGTLQDIVNNVENIYIEPPLASQYSITIVGRNVNVNAVTEHPDNVAQDYALVVSSGDAEVADALVISSDTSVVPSEAPTITVISNSFPAGGSISGQLLLEQRVGANTPLLGTNQIGVPDSAEGRITVGITNQWHFYILTNTTSFTNAAFATFVPPTLGLPRMGVTNEDEPDLASRPEADIDLYVSKDPSLLQLDLATLTAARKSLRRGGTEVIIDTNSLSGDVYYVGVKAEDQQAAEYGFLGMFSELPFNERDANGNLLLRGVPAPAIIPDGAPSTPGVTFVLGLAVDSMLVRRVVVTNRMIHQNFGDLIGSLNHDRRVALLNNHTPGNGATDQTRTYDDLGETAGLGSSDGPGTLANFVGEEAAGVWMMAQVDNVSGSTGRVEQLTIRLEPQQDTNGISLAIEPDSFVYNFIDVPPDATNLTISVSGNTGPLQLFVRRGSLPSETEYDYTRSIPPPGASLSIGLTDLPPLQAGRYYVAIFNPNGVSQNIRLQWTIGLNTLGVSPIRFGGTGAIPILDDAVTHSSVVISNDAKIATVSVGVRLDHPRVSDLVLTLISPTGQRFLLFEDRGGPSTANLGSSLATTNVFPTTVSGGPAADTNVLVTGATSGTLIIDHDFFSVADTMTIYYDGVALTNTGPVTGAGNFSVDYGPGSSTFLTIVMNEGGNPNTNTLWNYTARVVTLAASYLTFTEDTNFARLPIKFLGPPYADTGVSTNFLLSGFEVAATNYVSPTIVDGWSLTTNLVSVVNDSTALSGTNFLALGLANLSRTIPTTPGKSYALSYGYRGPGIVAMYPAESTPDDLIGTTNGTLSGGATYAGGYIGSGSFSFPNITSKVHLGDPEALKFTNAFSIEAWVFPYAWAPSGGHNQIVYRGDTRNFFDPYYFSIQPSGALRLHISSGGVGTDLDGGVVPTNQWVHVACTFHGPSGTMAVYTNGVLAGRTITAEDPFKELDPGFAPGVAIGNLSGQNGQNFLGLIDQLSFYNRALSAAEISAIHSRGTAGKYNPAFQLPSSLSQARVTLGNISQEIVFGNNTNWTARTLPFTTTQSGIPFTIESLQPGMLLDSVTLDQSPGDLFVLPEVSLRDLVGQNARGTWTLEIWDTRAGATPAQLIDWQLRFIFETNTPVPISLNHGEPATNTIPPCEIAYFVVDVPLWASFATNILLSTTPALPVSVLFNQTNPPTGTPADFVLIGNATSGSAVLDTNGAPLLPQLLPGRRYYLGVTNHCDNAEPVTVVLRVDYDITALTNGVPLSSMLFTNNPLRYFSYSVTNTNAIAALFELFDMDGNVDLVVRKGALPTLFNYDYGSFNAGTNKDTVLVGFNSVPVPLDPPSVWYLGVYNRTATNVAYTVKATEFGQPNIIPLTNDVPLDFSSEPGPALTNFFSFTIDQTNSAALFELYNLSGNADLNLQRDELPLTAPYFASSTQLGTNYEQIVIRTNGPFAILPDINGIWYLAVPNNDGVPVTYTIRAVVATNGILISTRPIEVSISTSNLTSTSGPLLTWPSVSGERYQVLTSTNLESTNWMVLTTVVAPGPLIQFVDPNPIYNVPVQFYRINQVP